MPEKQVPRVTPWGWRGFLGVCRMCTYCSGAVGGGRSSLAGGPWPSCAFRAAAGPQPAHPGRCGGRMSSREGYSRSQNSMKFNFPPI